MFIRLIPLGLVLGLCGWCWVQWQRIDNLKAENRTQAQTITKLETMQKHLKLALKQEQQAVIYQQNLAKKLKAEMGNKREKVKVILQKEPCAAVPLPNDVIKQLQQ